ncbi:ElyC/SanA/YdcF family protein [Thalassotalea profundi]|uniref:Membrane protein n=1 Tax=Thalassotalea profundi TaxID=2036687 RepID=A0ABQ3IGF0_9GAMM|nr:ElyC/SanA/YdcF family protein [Thalassotalea profundi]GHE83664.1 membrane protein [Thalassotalea profundi]
MDLFFLKKVVTAMIMPLSVALLLLLVALILFRKKPAMSFKCLIAGFILLLTISLSPISDRIMRPIETQYSAFTHSKAPVDYIIILGCGHRTDNTMPITSQLKACSLERLIEGIRILNIHPEATLITSGAAHDDVVANAEKVKQAALLLGVNNSKILVEPFAKDTEEEAELIAPRVKGKNVVLVTNADHMPRAMSYFNQQGVNAIAAPASPWVKGFHDEKGWGYYVPNTKSLAQTTRAWYEYVGQLVQWLKTLF